MDTDQLEDRLLAKLKKFDGLDLTDPIMVVGVNAVATGALSSVLKPHGGFSGDVRFDYDPDPYLKVSWWQSMTGTGEEIIIRFDPLRVQDNKADLIAAYNRAMKVI